MKHFIVLFITILTSISCQGQNKVQDSSYDSLLNIILKHNVPEITVIDASNKKDVVFLDAREQKEYNVSHIPGAIWVGYEDFNLSRVRSVSKSSRVIVYCSVGYRSEKITEKLINAGFSNSQNLYGGIFEWVNEKHIIVNNAYQTTQKIHAYEKSWGIWLSKGDKVY